MTTAAGIWAWHNQYNTLPLAKCVERAQRAKLEGVIVKYGLPEAEKAYAAAGIRWATERFAYADSPISEGNKLADAVDAGACFAVINAEEGGGWGPATATGPAMERLIDTFRIRHSGAPLYASIDTRGDRLSHPYQQVMLERCNGIMPMIYPGAFRPSQPGGYIEEGIADCLWNKDFRHLPVFPTLQSYSWEYPKGSGQIHAMGPFGISRQAELLKVYGGLIQGFQFYTIHHATDAEWEEVCKVVAACSAPPLTTATELELRKAYMDLAGKLMAFQPDSLQQVVNVAAAFLGTRPTL
jgi:hypothetical protein